MKILVELVDVHYSYGKKEALHGLNLQVRAGEVVALLGANGAGKTTAIEILLGLRRPGIGQVKRSVAVSGVMLQAGGVPATLRVREHLELFASYYDKPIDWREIAGRVGLAGLEEEFYAQLSGGQKQRLLFGLAIVGNADWIVLDEPTVGMDAEARRGLWREVKSLRSQGKGILLTTHYIEEAEALASRVVVMERGRVLREGSVEEIKQGLRAATLEEAYLELTGKQEVAQ
ncbi:MAG: ABC transporter ATP-binding protein [Bryobacter sp.]|jgi:ABC-2 type transport system ATP-binding protein|nr:ABC transporter ATP-binding protein [Bryobacter sp. CoA8 C33]